MRAIATNWKMLLAVGRSSAPAAGSQARTVAPAPAAPQEQPISNEIRDFPQLD